MTDTIAPVIDWNKKLLEAARFGIADDIKEALDEGADVNAQENDGYTALISTSNEGDIEIAKALLKVDGINVDAETDFGYTALMRASEKGHTEIVVALLQGGADVKAKTSLGTTSLHKATIHGHIKIVEALLQTDGIEINAKDNQGRTALDLANTIQRTEITKLIEAAYRKELQSKFDMGGGKGGRGL